MGVLGRLIQMGTDINDRVIFDSLVDDAKKTAKAYLTAVLVSSSPDLRAYFSAQITQVINFHSALVALGTEKGWLSPTSPPCALLEKEVRNAEALICNDAYPGNENT